MLLPLWCSVAFNKLLSILLYRWSAHQTPSTVTYLTSCRSTWATAWLQPWVAATVIGQGRILDRNRGNRCCVETRIWSVSAANHIWRLYTTMELWWKHIFNKLKVSKRQIDKLIWQLAARLLWIEDDGALLLIITAEVSGVYLVLVVVSMFC